MSARRSALLEIHGGSIGSCLESFNIIKLLRVLYTLLVLLF